jgi:Ca2+/Na+ antiporter
MNLPKAIRIAIKAVFYLLMIFFAVLIIRSKELHPLLQLALILIIASVCFVVREIDHAVEIDDRIPMNREEEIIYHEMKEKEKEREFEEFHLN